MSSVVLSLVACLVSSAAAAGTVSGSLVQWQRVTVDFSGPTHGEMDTSPNPFLDYRLQVSFTAPVSGTVYSVPGFFDGDGNGGGTGSVWRVRFAPDEPGTWSYVASFRSGTNVAISLDPAAGSPTGFDGDSGSFAVAARDPNAPGFLALGRLESIDEHYFKFRDGGYWAKLGTNNPENLLGYAGFDNTPYAWHTFANHVADWQSGDPDWDSPDTVSTHDGRGIIGALNYLAAKHLNSIYFMPMNIGADGTDTWPYADPNINRNGSSSNDDKHFDISKLAQWEIVFDHAQRKSLFLHFVLSDKTVANKNELDNATLGVERKLFYRELIARFGHHNALQWNVCEEYNLDLPLSPTVIAEFGRYIADVDPYHHPVTVHSHGNTYPTALAPFFDDSDWFRVMSVQTWQRPEDISYAIEWLRDQSEQAANPVPVMLDESIGMNQISATEYRKRTFWDALLSGGGFEMFKSYGDSDLDDFRVYDTYFTYAGHAIDFVQENLPFWAMVPDDGLVTGDDPLWGGAEVLAKTNEVYAIYLPKASPAATLSLAGATGSFELRWYDPRTGQFAGSPVPLTGGGPVSLGLPPSSTGEDWVALVVGTNLPAVLSNAQPNGTLPPGTTDATLSVESDVPADCRWSPLPGIDYASMPSAFETTGGTTHSTPVGGLEDGRAYVFYVRCMDGDGDVNPIDFEIAFEVGAVVPPPIGDRAVWYLDEGTGTVVGDASGQGNVGTLVNDPQWIAGYTGQALEFDGVDDRVEVPDAPSLDFSSLSGLTVALWARPASLGAAADRTLYGHWSAASSERPFQILLTAASLLQCRTNDHDGEATAPTPVAVDTWVHVACVWTPSGLDLWVDGTLVASDPDVVNALQASSDLHTLGARAKSGDFSQFFDGALDEVHVFGRALTANEIYALHNAFDCTDADHDGVETCDGDCDDSNPDCTTDCTDADGDGLCVTVDCDDSVPSADTVPFGDTIVAPDRDALVWGAATDVHWVAGDLGAVADYGTTAAGSLAAAVSLDVSADAPAPGTGFYYVLREQGCGTWQSQPGAEPGRDTTLP